MRKDIIATTDAQVLRAIYLVDTSGVVEMLENLVIRAPQGRPRQLTLRTWLIGALLAVDNGAGFKAVAIHASLWGMSVEMQWQLGVRYEDRRGKVHRIAKSHVDYISKNLPRWLACTRAGAARFGLEISDEELDRRRDGLQDAMDALLDASKAETHDAGWFAADGSSTWSWGRAPRKVTDDKDVRTHEEVFDDRARDEDADAALELDETDREPSDDDQDDEAEAEDRKQGSHDYDAAFGSKTADGGGRQAYFGYVLDAMVRIAPPGEPTVPMVIERLVVSPASTDVVAPTFRLLDSLSQTGVAITDLVIDRHYSYKAVERWADPLRARKINQHFDLRADEQRFRDVNGLNLVAGWVHCPATPNELGEIPRPGLGATPQQREAFAAKIKERESWALARDERPNAKGRARFICPAIDGRRGCPLREGTVEIARLNGLPSVENPPDLATAPGCCTNDSGKVVVNEPQLRKHDQPYYWGTEAWLAAYNRRTYVEGVFGSIKSLDTEGLRRGFTRYVGLPMLTIGLTVAAAVANTRHQRMHWAGRDDAPQHPLLGDEPDYQAVAYLTPEQVEVLDRDHLQHPPAA